MKSVIVVLLFMLGGPVLKAQKYITRDGFIGFYSKTPLEDINAENNQVASVIDTGTGEMVFEVLIRSFHFARALMEQDFNADYMESDKYPKSAFSGKIDNAAAVSFSKKGTYDVNVTGNLTIHNVTRKVTVKGTIEVVEGGINANSKFRVRPEDYNIKIPEVVRDKINKDLEVTVAVKYTPLQNK